MADSSVSLYPASESRPDLAIPSRPQTRPVAILRIVFAQGERRTLKAAITLAVLVVARFAVVPGLRGWLDLAAVLAGWYLAGRLAAGRWFRARQLEFEPLWLEEQSRVLAAAFFEVVRLGVQEAPDPRTGAVRLRTYDLTSGDDVAQLLRRQTAERAGGRSSRVRVEFAYSRGPARHPALETVHLNLADLPISGSEGARRARIRFPLGRYHAEPRVTAGCRDRPGRTTFWVLGPGVLFTTAPAGMAAPFPVTSYGLGSDH